MAAAHEREIDIYTVGVVTCRPTMREARDYHDHCIVEQADWDAVDNILDMRKVDRTSVSPEELDQLRRHVAHGLGGVPIIGDPDHVAGELARFAEAGITGMGFSFVNYADELPFFCQEVVPRLRRMGLRA